MMEIESEFKWHVLSKCEDEKLCPIHGSEVVYITTGEEDKCQDLSRNSP
jgi:hypothetical protein